MLTTVEELSVNFFLISKDSDKDREYFFFQTTIDTLVVVNRALFD